MPGICRCMTGVLRGALACLCAMRYRYPKLSAISYQGACQGIARRGTRRSCARVSWHVLCGSMDSSANSHEHPSSVGPSEKCHPSTETSRAAAFKEHPGEICREGPPLGGVHQRTRVCRERSERRDCAAFVVRWQVMRLAFVGPLVAGIGEPSRSSCREPHPANGAASWRDRTKAVWRSRLSIL
jgi:hypothetical protein